MDSTDLGADHPTLIFTDPEVAEKLTSSDTGDSETEGPQISFIGEYCRTCISKWSRCICKPGSDWDEDPINIIPQTDSPSNKDQNDRHPLLSDWSDQENFWSNNETEERELVEDFSSGMIPERIPIVVSLQGSSNSSIWDKLNFENSRWIAGNLQEGRNMTCKGKRSVNKRVYK